MKLNLIHLSNEALDLTIDSFNTEILNIRTASSIKELRSYMDKNPCDILLIDENFIDSKSIADLVEANITGQTTKVIMITEDFKSDLVIMAINELGVSKIVHRDENMDELHFHLNSTIEEIFSTTSLFGKNKQLEKENRELEFILSQYLLED